MPVVEGVWFVMAVSQIHGAFRYSIQERIASAVADAAEEIRSREPSLTSQLQQRARVAGWPPWLCNVLSVTLSPAPDAVWPPEVDELVNVLEYGDENRVPRPVIRPFLNRVVDAQ